MIMSTFAMVPYCVCVFVSRCGEACAKNQMLHFDARFRMLACDGVERDRTTIVYRSQYLTQKPNTVIHLMKNDMCNNRRDHMHLLLFPSDWGYANAIESNTHKKSIGKRSGTVRFVGFTLVNAWL